MKTKDEVLFTLHTLTKEYIDSNILTNEQKLHILIGIQSSMTATFVNTEELQELLTNEINKLKPKTITQYLDKPYKILYFIGLLWDWQENLEPEFLVELENLPEEVINNYRIRSTLFRGMTVDLNEVRDKDICSWSTDFKIAKLTAETYIHPNTLIGNSTPVYNVVYLKQGIGLDMYKIIQEMKEWLTENEDYIVTETEWDLEKLLQLFKEEECEILSNFKQDEVEIVHKTKVS